MQPKEFQRRVDVAAEEMAQLSNTNEVTQTEAVTDNRELQLARLMIKGAETTEFRTLVADTTEDNDTLSDVHTNKDFMLMRGNDFVGKSVERDKIRAMDAPKSNAIQQESLREFAERGGDVSLAKLAGVRYEPRSYPPSAEIVGIPARITKQERRNFS